MKTWNAMSDLNSHEIPHTEDARARGAGPAAEGRPVKRIARVIRAFFSAVAFFVSRQPGPVMIVLLVVAIACLIVYAELLPPETRQQQQARIAPQEQQEAQQKAQKERTKSLCALKSACEKYGAARQECAVAGNFKNCLRVKMGSDDYEMSDSCTEDGKPAGVADSDIPNSVTCFASGL
jgi:hypothetical protein